MTVSQTDRILVDTLHTLLCDLPHSDDMHALLKRENGAEFNSELDPEECFYYLENSLSECDSLADHVYGWSKVEALKRQLNVRSSSEALTSLYRVLDVVEQLNALPFPARRLFSLLATSLLNPD